MEDTVAKLKRIIIEQGCLSYGDICITESTNLIQELGFDSVALVNLILEIEREFSIEIDNYDVDIICEFGTLLKMIKHITMSKEENND